jgi:hypothetical protein
MDRLVWIQAVRTEALIAGLYLAVIVAHPPARQLLYEGLWPEAGRASTLTRMPWGIVPNTILREELCTVNG